MSKPKAVIVRFYNDDIDLFYNIVGQAKKLKMTQTEFIKLAIKEYERSRRT